MPISPIPATEQKDYETDSFVIPPPKWQYYYFLPCLLKPIPVGSVVAELLPSELHTILHSLNSS